MDLFDQQIIPVPLSPELGDASISFWPNWLSASEADALLQTAIDKTPWRQDNIRMMGKTIPLPRLQNWFGDPQT
ncbi:MAG: alpha-ketoglutarate-dependent dioxygenase AlkB, partial [Porticoccaceae bacterium]